MRSQMPGTTTECQPRLSASDNRPRLLAKRVRARAAWLPMLTVLLEVLLGGCGGQTRTVTKTTTSTTTASTTVARSTAPGHVPTRVIARVVPSIAEVECDNGGQTNFLGSGFVTAAGLVTASHVVGPCIGGAIGTVAIDLPELPGYVQSFDSRIRRDDPTDDLALLQLGTAEATLSLDPANSEVKLGEPLTLIGFPGGDRSRPMTIDGTVGEVDRPEVLTSAEGVRETIRDAIVVAASGVREGESGGAAVDSAGQVVGVIEGAGSGVVILTPIRDSVNLG